MDPTKLMQDNFRENGVVAFINTDCSNNALNTFEALVNRFYNSHGLKLPESTDLDENVRRIKTPFLYDNEKSMLYITFKHHRAKLKRKKLDRYEDFPSFQQDYLEHMVISNFNAYAKGKRIGYIGNEQRESFLNYFTSINDKNVIVINKK